MKTLQRLIGVAALAGTLALPVRGAGQPAPAEAAVSPGYVPCAISAQAPAVFPLRLIANGITWGEVRVILEIGPDGQLTDSLVAAYTQREFAVEVRRVLRTARFTPGRVDGRPVGSVLSLTYRFETNGVVAIQRVGPPDRTVETFGRDFEYQPHGITTIDQPPSARKMEGPVYPKKWSDEGRTGEVTVDFYIDEGGRTRMPVALGSPDEYLGSAAVAAVRNWRFEPPRHQGKPALAHAQQTFVFKLEPLTSPAPGP